MNTHTYTLYCVHMFFPFLWFIIFFIINAAWYSCSPPDLTLLPYTHTHRVWVCVSGARLHTESYLFSGGFLYLEHVTPCSYIMNIPLCVDCVWLRACVSVVSGLSWSIVFGSYEWGGLVFGSLKALSLVQQASLSLTLIAVFCICHNCFVCVCLNSKCK